MSTSIPNCRRGDRTCFENILDAIPSAEGLPYANILSADRIGHIFRKHDGLFGRQRIYTTAILV